LNFKLLADTDAKVSEQYGSIMEYNGMKLSARNTSLRLSRLYKSSNADDADRCGFNP